MLRPESGGPKTPAAARLVAVFPHPLFPDRLNTAGSETSGLWPLENFLTYVGSNGPRDDHSRKRSHPVCPTRSYPVPLANSAQPTLIRVAIPYRRSWAAPSSSRPRSHQPLARQPTVIARNA